MNCIEFETAVERSVETREPLAENMLAHTATCSACRNVLEMHQQLDAAIEEWRLAIPPAGLADSVVMELAESSWSEDSAEMRILLGLDEFKTDDTKVRSVFVGRSTESVVRRKTRTGGLAMSSVAACLVIAVIAISSYSGRDAFDRPNEFALVPFTQRGIQSSKTDLNVSSALTGLFSELGTEYREMASETTSAAKEIINVIPQRVAATIISETNEITNEIELLPSTSEVTRMWQPIGSRVGTALSFLLQAVPSEVPSG